MSIWFFKRNELLHTYFQIFLYYLLENGFLYFIMAVAKKKRIHHTKKGCRETWQGMIGAHTLRGDLETIDLEIWKSWENPFGHIYISAYYACYFLSRWCCYLHGWFSREKRWLLKNHVVDVVMSLQMMLFSWLVACFKCSSNRNENSFEK